MRFTLGDTVARLTGATINDAAVSMKKWNIACAAVFVVEAVAIFIASRPYMIPINLAFLTSDSLQTSLTGTMVTAPAVRELTQVNIAYLLVALLLLSAIVPTLSATVFARRYQENLRRRANGLRWVQAAGAASLMAATLGLLVGAYDLASLVLLAGFAAVTFIFGYSLEIASLQDGRQKPIARLSAVVGVKSGVVVLAVIGLYLLSGAVFGGIRVPSSDLLLYGTLVAFFAGVIANSHLTNMKRSHWVNYVFADRVYIWLLIIGVSLFTWGTFWAVLR